MAASMPAQHAIYIEPQQNGSCSATTIYITNWRCTTRRAEVGYVFVSYSRLDRANVEKLAAHLRSAGIEVWFDYEIATGERFSAVIKSKIENCAAMIGSCPRRLKS